MIVLTGFVQIFESKIKASLFFQTKIYFPDSSLSKKVINRDLEKTHELCFFYEALQTCNNHSARRLNKVWLRVKKTSFTNQKIQPLYHFSRIFLYFPDYFQIWKIALQISRVFKNSRLCKNQVKCDFKHLTNKTDKTNLHSIQPHLRSQHCACAVRYSVSSFLSSEVPKQTNKLLF